MFIVFEGGDGSGKSTQSKILVEELRSAFPARKIVWTREPGGSPGAEDIRALLVQGDAHRWSPETEMLLFNAARRDHVERVIQPTLEAGGIVVCDRYVGSTIAYQGVRGRDLAEKAKRLHDEMIGLNPHLTFFLDRPAADASIDARGLDRMEEAQKEFRAKTKQQFGMLMANDPTWVGVFAEDKDTASRVILKTAMASLQIAQHADTKMQMRTAKVFMDEGYFRSLPGLTMVSSQIKDATLLDGETRTDVLAYGANREENPLFIATRADLDVVSGTPVLNQLWTHVNGRPVQFAGIDPEAAEAMVFEKIEADLPDLMDVYSGADQTPSLS